MSFAGRVDAVVDAAIAARRIVGSVVLIALDGELIYARAAGLADREARVPMPIDAVFRLASLTKPIVSVAVMRLVETGALDLASPVTALLPGFRPRLPDGSEPEISLARLITHTAGLSYPFLEPPASAYRTLRISSGLDMPGYTEDEQLSELARAPLVYPPGENWRYSLALDVLGLAAGRAAGSSLPELVRATVTGPLGMRETSFAPPRDLDRLVTPYADGDPEPVRMSDGIVVGSTSFAPSRALDPRSYPSAGAGMIGTGPDFMRFLECLRTGGAPIVSPATLERMRADNVPATPAMPLGPAMPSGPGWTFGIGWGVLLDPHPTQTPQSIGTIAWGGAYGHQWFVDFERRLSLIALTNTTREGMAGKFPIDLRDAVYAR